MVRSEEKRPERVMFTHPYGSNQQRVGVVVVSHTVLGLAVSSEVTQHVVDVSRLEEGSTAGCGAGRRTSPSRCRSGAVHQGV